MHKKTSHQLRQYYVPAASSILLYINSSRVADTSRPSGLAFTGPFGPNGFFHSDLSARLASFIQTTSFFQLLGPISCLPFTDFLARLARAAFWLTSPLSPRHKTYEHGQQQLVSADLSGPAGHLSQHQPRHSSAGEKLLLCSACLLLLLALLLLFSAATRLSVADHCLAVVVDARVYFLCCVCVSQLGLPTAQ